MICSKCTRKMHARGLCASHYTAWYREHVEEVKRERERPHHVRKWKFTAEHWWKWWDKRTPDVHTLERRAQIQSMRRTLP